LHRRSAPRQFGERVGRGSCGCCFLGSTTIGRLRIAPRPFWGAIRTSPNVRVRFFFVAFHLTSDCTPVTTAFGSDRGALHHTSGLHRFYQIGSAAVGAGAEAVFFSRGASAPAAAPSAAGGGWALSDKDGGRPLNSQYNCDVAARLPCSVAFIK
jgi:hypothetical protein